MNYAPALQLVCLPITHILLFSPIHLVVPSSIHLITPCTYSRCTSYIFIYAHIDHSKEMFTLPFYFHIQHINLFPVKLAFHFSLKSHILCLCCCIFRLNAPAKSTSYHNLHNQLLPSHHTRSGTHWTTTNLTPTAPKTLTYEHTLNADFGTCTCDIAMYVVINVYV